MHPPKRKVKRILREFLVPSACGGQPGIRVSRDFAWGGGSMSRNEFMTGCREVLVGAVPSELNNELEELNLWAAAAAIFWLDGLASPAEFDSESPIAAVRFLRASLLEKSHDPMGQPSQMVTVTFGPDPEPSTV